MQKVGLKVEPVLLENLWLRTRLVGEEIGKEGVGEKALVGGLPEPSFWGLRGLFNQAAEKGCSSV